MLQKCLTTTLPDYIVECLDEFINHYGTLEEVVEHKDDIYYYPDCETMTDVAYYYIDELQALGDIPPSLQNYIDYEAYGRDLDMGNIDNINSKEAIEARTQAISGYLTKELQDLNVDTIRTDISTSSTVTDVIVWSIEQLGTDTFSATYEVDQQIKEGEQTSNVKATYTVKVHVDADGDMVIIQSPTLAPAIEKSDYEPKAPEANASVDADTVNDATAFLETFFKIYPTATEKELAYYVSGNVIEPIGRDYLYSELINPIFTKDGDNVKVKVAVKFLDNQTKATQVSQYELVLHKDSNWKIVG